MPVSDILARIAGMMMVMSSMLNGLWSLIWVGSLIWVCVGVFWFVPMFLALVVAGIGVAMMVLGHQQWGIAGPVLSLVASFCNFNVMGVMFDMVTLALMIGSLVMRNQENAALANEVI